MTCLFSFWLFLKKKDYSFLHFKNERVLAFFIKKLRHSVKKTNSLNKNKKKSTFLVFKF